MDLDALSSEWADVFCLWALGAPSPGASHAGALRAGRKPQCFRATLSVPRASGRDLRAQSPPGCPHPAPGAWGLEEASSRGDRGPCGPQGRRAGCPHPGPPTMPPHHPPFPLHGPGTAREGLGPPQPHWGSEVASCLSFPSCTICTHPAPPKPDIFPESRGTAPRHTHTLTAVALMVSGHPGPHGPRSGPPLHPGFARRGLVRPNCLPGPGLWQAQVSAPVITRKVELAPLPRRDGWRDTALIMGEIRRLRGQWPSLSTH